MVYALYAFHGEDQSCLTSDAWCRPDAKPSLKCPRKEPRLILPQQLSSPPDPPKQPCEWPAAPPDERALLHAENGKHAALDALQPKLLPAVLTSRALSISRSASGACNSVSPLPATTAATPPEEEGPAAAVAEVEAEAAAAECDATTAVVLETAEPIAVVAVSAAASA
jgi:hypothetical protein